MIDTSKWMSGRTRLVAGAALLLAVGAAGGAGATAMTRPGLEMAPANAVAIASLPQRQGIVTVRGRIAEAYGNRLVVADGSGKAMIDAGRAAGSYTVGAPVTVQGRYEDGQLRASFMIDHNGTVEQVGPPPPAPGHGPRGVGRDAPPPPPAGPGAAALPPGSAGAPPSPAGCLPATPNAAAPATPPVASATPPAPTVQPR